MWEKTWTNFLISNFRKNGRTPVVGMQGWKVCVHKYFLQENQSNIFLPLNIKKYDHPSNPLITNMTKGTSIINILKLSILPCPPASQLHWLECFIGLHCASINLFSNYCSHHSQILSVKLNAIYHEKKTFWSRPWIIGVNNHGRDSMAFPWLHIRYSCCQGSAMELWQWSSTDYIHRLEELWCGDSIRGIIESDSVVQNIELFI